MNKFMEKFAEIGGRVGNQKHMSAIRDAFAFIMPLILAGAFAVMINNVLFVPWSFLARFIGEDSGFIVFAHAYIAPLFVAVHGGSMALMAIALVIALGYVRASQEKVDPITTAIMAFGAFFVLGPITTNAAGEAHVYLDASGIFVALITGLLASEIYIFFMKKGWVIKMPDMVPPAVGKGFAALIPGTLTLVIFALVPWLFAILVKNGVLVEGDPTNIFAFVESTIQDAFLSLIGSTDPSKLVLNAAIIFFVTIMQTILWFFGLHGANMLAPVINTVWLPLELTNAELFMNGAALSELAPWTSSSWVIYVNHGGSGATLGLLIALFIFNKRPDSKEIVKLSIAPGIFEINEPVIFGMPIVLNPIYAIPFILSTPIMAVVAYIGVVIGLGSPVVNNIPWTTPPIVAALLATNGHIGSVILALITLAISVFIYLPFVLLSNKEFENGLKNQEAAAE